MKKKTEIQKHLVFIVLFLNSNKMKLHSERKKALKTASVAQLLY